MILPGILTLQTPRNPLPLIFDSPHSGRHYPHPFPYDCDHHALRQAEDHYVDDLFSSAPDHGAALLCALFPRTYIDVNRAEGDIDPAILSEPWGYGESVPLAPSARALAGIGLIRTMLKTDQPLTRRKLHPSDIMSRIETYYRPYHTTLKHSLDEAYQNNGQVWHINCHSMPSRPFGDQGALRPSPAKKADFVLGDRDGTSCDTAFTHAVRDFLVNKGYKVAINNPYKGVELIRRYSDPARGRHSLQIEICKSLYMNEETLEKNKNFSPFKRDIESLIAFLAAYARSRSLPQPAD